MKEHEEDLVERPTSPGVLRSSYRLTVENNSVCGCPKKLRTASRSQSEETSLVLTNQKRTPNQSSWAISPTARSGS